MSDVANKDSYQQIKNKLQIRSIDNEQSLTGTEAAPSLAFGDRDTGFYEISDDVIGVTQNGSLTAGWGAGTAASPTYFFGDGDTGFYEVSANAIGVSISGTNTFIFDNDEFKSATSGGFVIRPDDATDIIPSYTFQGDPNTGIGTAGLDQLSLIAGGVEGIRVTESGGSITVDISDSLNAVCNAGNVVCNEGGMVFN